MWTEIGKYYQVTGNRYFRTDWGFKQFSRKEIPGFGGINTQGHYQNRVTEHYQRLRFDGFRFFRRISRNTEVVNLIIIRDLFMRILLVTHLVSVPRLTSPPPYLPISLPHVLTEGSRKVLQTSGISTKTGSDETGSGWRDWKNLVVTVDSRGYV